MPETPSAPSLMAQSVPPQLTGKMPYSSSIECAVKVFREGGPLRFYSGFPTFYFRIAPHAMITLLAQDMIKKYMNGPPPKQKAATERRSRLKLTMTEVDRVFTCYDELQGSHDCSCQGNTDK